MDIDSENLSVKASISRENVKCIRITDHGKMKSWISCSLTFFDDNVDKSIILHTLPPSICAGSVATLDSEKASISRQSAAGATSAIPRLVSVVEIIKREYLKALEAKRSSRLQGLYQYNEVGTLEQHGMAITPTLNGGTEVEDVRSINIVEAISGRNHPRQTQSPFMRITLSTMERPDLLERGATFQAPPVRKLSKSANARVKKKLRIKTDAESPSTFPSDAFLI